MKKYFIFTLLLLSSSLLQAANGTSIDAKSYCCIDQSVIDKLQPISKSAELSEFAKITNVSVSLFLNSLVIETEINSQALVSVLSVATMSDNNEQSLFGLNRVRWLV